MKKLIKIILVSIFTLNYLTVKAQAASAKVIDRGKSLELKTATYKATPGDELSLNTAGYAKIMCSAVFI